MRRPVCVKQNSCQIRYPLFPPLRISSVSRRSPVQAERSEPKGSLDGVTRPDTIPEEGMGLPPFPGFVSACRSVRICLCTARLPYALSVSSRQGVRRQLSFGGSGAAISVSPSTPRSNLGVGPPRPRSHPHIGVHRLLAESASEKQFLVPACSRPQPPAPLSPCAGAAHRAGRPPTTDAAESPTFAPLPPQPVVSPSSSPCPRW